MIVHPSAIGASAHSSRLAQEVQLDLVEVEPIGSERPARRSPYGTPRPHSDGCGRPQRFRPGACSGRWPSVSLTECGSRSGKRHALEGEDLSESVEVRVTVEYGEAAVLGGGGGDQRVGERHAVIAVPAARQLT